jgi:hypothetical protein
MIKSVLIAPLTMAANTSGGMASHWTVSSVNDQQGRHRAKQITGCTLRRRPRTLVVVPLMTQTRPALPAP